MSFHVVIKLSINKKETMEPNAIIYYKISNAIYGRRSINPIVLADYESIDDWKEVIKDKGVIWAKLINDNTGKIFKSYKRK